MSRTSTKRSFIANNETAIKTEGSGIKNIHLLCYTVKFMSCFHFYSLLKDMAQITTVTVFEAGVLAQVLKSLPREESPLHRVNIFQISCQDVKCSDMMIG